MYDLRTDIYRGKPTGKVCSDDMRDINAKPRYNSKGVELPQYKPRRDKRVRVVEHTGVTGSTAISHNGDDWSKRWQYLGDPDEAQSLRRRLKIDGKWAMVTEPSLADKIAMVAQHTGIAQGINALRQALRVRDNIRAWIDSQRLDPSIARRLIAVKLRLLLIIMLASRLVVIGRGVKAMVASAKRATKRLLAERQARWLQGLNPPTP